MTAPNNIVIAADLSGKTGWCAGSSLADVKFGLIRLPNAPDNPGSRWAAARNHICDLIEEWRAKVPGVPVYLVIERDYPAHRQTHQTSAVQQMSLTAIMELAAHDEDVMLRKVSPSTVRTYVMGRGHGKMDKKAKEGGEIVRWLMRQGWSVFDHNVADAILLWAWGKELKNVIR